MAGRGREQRASAAGTQEGESHWRRREGGREGERGEGGGREGVREGGSKVGNKSPYSGGCVQANCKLTSYFPS